LSEKPFLDARKVLLIVSEFGEPNGGQYCYADAFYRSFVEIFALASSLAPAENIKVIKFNCKRKIFSRYLGSFAYLNYLLRTLDTLLINIALFFYVTFLLKPWCVFFIKAENINYRLLRYLKNHLAFSPYLLMFYPDSPFAFFNGNSNSNILLSLPYYDTFFIWNKKLIPVLQGAGACRAVYFPFYPELQNFPAVKTLIAAAEKKYDVSFVGAWDKKREDYLTHLILHLPKVKLVIAGPLWLEMLDEESALRSCILASALNFEEMILLFAHSKICLNILKEQNANSHNMRTFEVPASGSFLLAEYSREQDEFFKKEQQADYFSNKEQMLEKIKFYCKHISYLDKIAAAGYQKNKSYSLKKLLQEKTAFLFRKQYRQISSRNE